MGTAGAALGRVTNDGVWRITRVAFLAAALIFLITIVLGFLNIIVTGDLPRWQLLVHLHSGTMGWVTLATLGAAIWLFTGDRQVSPTYVTWTRWVVYGAIVTFLMLIASFGIAYSQGGDLIYLLVIAAPLASLVVWAAALFLLAQVSELRAMNTG